jgi:hypothetical protein
LIAYLEARKVFEDGFFARFLRGATRFFEVLADGPALVSLLEHLEERFNGHVFCLSKEDAATLRDSRQLARFARLVEGRQERGGQLTLWQRYSFADLPIELISHIYQLFVSDTAVAVYTPPFLVRLILGEVLSPERLDRLDREKEIILDPACGSGIFLVEAYKRLVLHWRSRNDWKRPKELVLKKLLTRVHGIDLEEGAVELAAFSLCLALCDALKPEEIRASVKLFPELKETSIHSGCFFEACEKGKVKEKVGVVVGNPPFSSSLGTPAAQCSYDRYQEKYGALPDKQLAYLFLNESMETLAKGGVLALLQQYNFLYNQQSLGFRRKFIERWNVREILDFISVRGLFQKGGADTKVIVVVAEANKPRSDRQILHATFRRSGRTDAEQGFDIDYYDMHWLPRNLAISNDGVWRSDLLGGGRVLGFVDRLKKYETLGQFAKKQAWNFGEGFILGNPEDPRPSEHVAGKLFLPDDFLSESGIDRRKLSTAPKRPYQRPRRKEIYTSPLLLIRENMELHHDFWTDGYLTYTSQIFGFGLPEIDVKKGRKVGEWMAKSKKVLRAYVAATSPRLFCQKATAISGADILNLPGISQDFDLRRAERIAVDDIVDYYRDLIRLGEDSAVMKKSGVAALASFNDIYTHQINAVYKKNKLRAVHAQTWPGVICQPFVFGKGKIDWGGADELKGKLDKLLHEQRSSGLAITRIARLFDGSCIFLLKPDRLRYWLRSVALRDADETLADLWEQGF